MRTEKPSLRQAALYYHRSGLCVLPAIRTEKRPAVSSWRQYIQKRPDEQILSGGMEAGPDAICIVCGEVSGNVEMIDFDHGAELFDAWREQLDPDLLGKLVIERTQSGGLHVIYRFEREVCGNIKLAQRRTGEGLVTLIETRGQGGLFLCAPTAGYELIQGDLAELPTLTVDEREALLWAAWSLNEVSSTGTRCTPRSSNTSDPRGSTDATRPGDDFNVRGDVSEILQQHGWLRVRGGENEYWRRPGKTTGTSATLKNRVFYVFSSNAAPLEPQTAYAPFSVYAHLEHGGDFEQAARALGAMGYGREPGGATPRGPDPEVDISGIMAECEALSQDRKKGKVQAAEKDPGPIPEHLFRVPGLISRVMDFTLANAPYPNVGLAFCGAIALQSYLCGRKVADTGGLRPNIFLLALAGSGTGKDFPRKVNTRVLQCIGKASALGDKFASGEGIQDALARTPAMLFQNDEMDGVLRQITADREARRESIPNILMTLYTSADMMYVLRVKAGKDETLQIDQPHLTLFGTATPQFFYESLSQRLMTNGFFSRLIVVDIGKRGEGQKPGSARNVPQNIIETARWWADYRGEGDGDLHEQFPEPRVVAATPEADEAMLDFQREADREYDKADALNDEVSKVAWSRTLEGAKKLALLYACSRSCEEPLIDLEAVDWARQFAIHQTRRKLFLAASYVAENPFHKECLKLLRKLREAGGKMQRQYLLKAMRCNKDDFDRIVSTLVQQGDVEHIDMPTRTKTAQGYQLTQKSQ